MCELHRGVYVSVCQKPERVSTAGARNLWLFQEGIKLASLAHVERVLFTLFFHSLLFLFGLFLMYRSSGFPSNPFLCSRLSALCANRRICVFVCVCGLSCLDLVITLYFAEEIPDVWKYTVRHGTVTWTCVFYPCTMAPRRYFSGVAEVQSPAWRSHPLETNQSSGCRAGTSVLLLSCFCLLENRIYLAFLKCAVDEGSLLKAPPHATSRESIETAKMNICVLISAHIQCSASRPVIMNDYTMFMHMYDKVTSIWKS